MPSNFQPRDPANPHAHYDAAKRRLFSRDTNSHATDASYDYSNLGFGLLGYALAQLEHTSYDARVDEEILKPLVMTMRGMISNRLVSGPRSRQVVTILYRLSAIPRWYVEGTMLSTEVRRLASQ
jgi:CubicO group peptidase (beta-lactamase class C family)